MTYERAKKEARRLQKAFAQHVGEPQPTYTWCRNLVLAAGDLSVTDPVKFTDQARAEWKARS